MVALTQASRVAGKAAMESSLTPVARARRRFKAGRPTKTKNVLITPEDALLRASKEYGKLQDLVQEECGDNFDATDTRAGLVYVTPDGKSQTFWMPLSWKNYPKKPIDLLSELSGSVFLGMVFHQLDRDADKPEAKHTFWVLQFIAGPEAETHLHKERDNARLALLS